MTLMVRLFSMDIVVRVEYMCTVWMCVCALKDSISQELSGVVALSSDVAVSSSRQMRLIVGRVLPEDHKDLPNQPLRI